jgi:hypothetical protein
MNYLKMLAPYPEIITGIFTLLAALVGAGKVADVLISMGKSAKRI